MGFRTHLAVALATAAFAATVIAATGFPAAAWAAPSDACALLTPAQVGAALGAPVGAGSPITPTDHKVCTWTSKGQGFVTLMLQTPAAVDAARAQAAGPMGKAVTLTPVAGLGDGAFYLAMGPNVGLVVKKGAGAFKVAVYQSGASLDKKQAAERQLAGAIVTKF